MGLDRGDVNCLPQEPPVFLRMNAQEVLPRLRSILPSTGRSGSQLLPGIWKAASYFPLSHPKIRTMHILMVLLEGWDKYSLAAFMVEQA